MTAYRSALLRELSRSRSLDLDDNYDSYQLGPEPPQPEPQPRPFVDDLLYRAWPSRYFSKHHAQEIDRGEFLYRLLADRPSRDLLVKLMAYRILGHRKVKLPRNNPDYWQGIKSMLDLRTDAPPVSIKFMDAQLAVYDLNPVAYDITCHASAVGLACAVVQKQYEYHRGGVHCKAESGDVAIDAGACWGETTMYFAHEAKTVVAFEFIPSNLEVLHRNEALNPRLRDRVHLVQNPLWSESGRKLHYVDWGPGSRVTDDINKYHSLDGTVETATIDETLARLGLRIDFIKMDIEGAELAALKGGETSIRKYRPKLAISLYHQPEDVETIPRYLAGLDLGYRFYLDHHTIYQNETVLFGVPS